MPRNGFQLAKRSLQFVRPYRRALSGVITLALILAALSAVDPLVMKYLFDELERRTGIQTLAAIMAGLVVLELTRAGLQAWLGILSWNVRLGVEYTLREQLVSKLNSLPISFHQREGVGGTMNRVNHGISGYVGAFSDVAFNLLPTLLYLILSVMAMLRMEWRLALAVIVFTPLPALIGAKAAPEQMRRERRLVERW
ncbi:MAG TPA: ABC transporter transmembrane domain-containing protein, partial [Gemmatimonadales bacterium]|nr:ABC transporter transmembrane domain-containing protein [Gemmatimonadales bacterium]